MAVLIPTTLSEAVDALAEHPGATLLAGGTDVMVEVNAGHRQPSVVVALDRVTELRSWWLLDGGRTIRIGAGCTYAELERGDIARLLPALAQASRTVGSPQIRNAGTIGGNLGTCSPAGDALPVLFALDAVLRLTSVHGSRAVPVAEFMVGVKRNVLEPGELIEAIDLPVLEGWQGYAKVGVRNAMVIATASACLAVDVPTTSVRLALGSVAPTIVRCADAERYAVSNLEWSSTTLDDNIATTFGALAAAASAPIDDHRSTAAYRRHAVGVLAERLLRRAWT
jgi:CO/xanthine dehydrogenase FAD-binding subunit